MTAGSARPLPRLPGRRAPRSRCPGMSQIALCTASATLSAAPAWPVRTMHLCQTVSCLAYTSLKHLHVTSWHHPIASCVWFNVGKLKQACYVKGPACVYSDEPGGRMAVSSTPSGRYSRMISVPFSSVLLLKKSPNFVSEPVSPASRSLGVSASSSACNWH